MARAPQNYGNHRRYMPAMHFFVTPVLVINMFVQIARLIQTQTLAQLWAVIVAAALVTFAFAARIMSLTAQNRVIRLEERLRLNALMPEDQRARINDLTPGQLTGLRFASDEEVVPLAQRCLNSELRNAGDVKKEVRNWRADYLRV